MSAIERGYGLFFSFFMNRAALFEQADKSPYTTD